MMLILSRLRSGLWMNRPAFLIVFPLTLALFAGASYYGEGWNTLVYCLAIALSICLVEFSRDSNAVNERWQIKDIDRDIKVMVLIVGLQLVLSSVHFIVVPIYEPINRILRVALVLMMLLIIYPVALLIYLLIFQKYRTQSLALEFSSRIVVAVPVIIILGGASLIISPELNQFEAMYDKLGLLQMILMGFMAAAIPEEISRFFIQTRVAHLVGNTFVGIAVGSLIWGALHFPRFYHESRDIMEAVFSTIKIIPLGLLWGYMTERFRSIWPSVLVHGTNLWGLA